MGAAGVAGTQRWVCVSFLQARFPSSENGQFHSLGVNWKKTVNKSTWVWELEYKESWVLKNWCFWTVVLEKTLENPLDSKEIKPLHPKGNQSWIFTGRTNAEAETSILWPPDAKKWLIGQDPDTRTDWRQKEKGTTEDEMVGWHHQLNGHEFEQAPGADDGQGELVCRSPWGSNG